MTPTNFIMSDYKLHPLLSRTRANHNSTSHTHGLGVTRIHGVLPSRATLNHSPSELAKRAVQFADSLIREQELRLNDLQGKPSTWKGHRLLGNASILLSMRKPI
jgi:hypothetical protein